MTNQIKIPLKLKHTSPEFQELLRKHTKIVQQERYSRIPVKYAPINPGSELAAYEILTEAIFRALLILPDKLTDNTNYYHDGIPKKLTETTR